MNIDEIKVRVLKAFNGDLGQLLDSIYSTSDGALFVRGSEAIKHSKNLENKSILNWYEEFHGNTLEPDYFYEVLR